MEPLGQRISNKRTLSRRKRRMSWEGVRYRSTLMSVMNIRSGSTRQSKRSRRSISSRRHTIRGRRRSVRKRRSRIFRGSKSNRRSVGKKLILESLI